MIRPLKRGQSHRFEHRYRTGNHHAFTVDQRLPNADNAQSMNRRNESGLTLTEVLVIISIILIVCALAMPSVSITLGRAQMTVSLSNMKGLHFVTLQMAHDRIVKGDSNLGWPGDTGGTFTNWTGQLLKGGYLTTNDLSKLLSAPGRIIPLGQIPVTNNTAVLVYAVSTNSDASTVFLSSANFTNTPTGGDPLSKMATPYGDRAFVVFRKDGCGTVLLGRQVGKTNLIGAFVPLCR